MPVLKLQLQVQVQVQVDPQPPTSNLPSPSLNWGFLECPDPRLGWAGLGVVKVTQKSAVPGRIPLPNFMLSDTRYPCPVRVDTPGTPGMKVCTHSKRKAAGRSFSCVFTRAGRWMLLVFGVLVCPVKMSKNHWKVEIREGSLVNHSLIPRLDLFPQEQYIL